MSGRYLVRHPLLLSVLTVADAVLQLVPRGTAPVPSRPASLLISNWAHLGDAINCLPALQWLRATYPDTRIGMIVSGAGKATVQGSNLVDAVYVIDHWSMNRQPISLRAKIAEYRRSRRRALADMQADGGYEVAVDLYPYFPSAAAILKASGAKVRIGYESGGFGPLLTHRLPWAFDGRHMGEHHADPLRVLAGGRPVELQHHQPAAKPARLAGLPERYVVVHTGAGSQEREWRPEQWVSLAAALASRHQVVIAGVGEREASRAAAIVQAAPACVNLVDKLTWNELGSVMAHADLLVSLDSAPSHVAAMFGTPVVAITSGRSPPGLWAPRSERAAVVTYPTACAPCFRTRGCESMACVKKVAVEEVIAAIRGLGIEV